MCARLQLVKSMPGNDRYVERGMNTFNELPKVKNIQTNKISYSVSDIDTSMCFLSCESHLNIRAHSVSYHVNHIYVT